MNFLANYLLKNYIQENHRNFLRHSKFKITLRNAITFYNES